MKNTIFNDMENINEIFVDMYKADQKAKAKAIYRKSQDKRFMDMLHEQAKELVEDSEYDRKI